MSEISLRGDENRQKYVKPVGEDRPSRFMQGFGYAIVIVGGVSLLFNIATDPNIIDLSLRMFLTVLGMFIITIWQSRQLTQREVIDRPLAPMDVAERSIKVKASYRHD